MGSQPATPGRQSARVVTDIEATWDGPGHRGRAFVYNVSTGGCMIESADERLFTGDVLALSMANVPPIDGKVVWQLGRFSGIQFQHPLAEATVSELGFKEPKAGFAQLLPSDRFGRMLPVLSGRLPF